MSRSAPLEGRNFFVSLARVLVAAVLVPPRNCCLDNPAEGLVPGSFPVLRPWCSVEHWPGDGEHQSLTCPVPRLHLGFGATPHVASLLPLRSTYMGLGLVPWYSLNSDPLRASCSRLVAAGGAAAPGPELRRG